MFIFNCYDNNLSLIHIWYWRESSVWPLLPMRIPISSPSKLTSRHPSVVLYLELISTSPSSMEENTSARNFFALFSISSITAASVMISTGFPAVSYTHLAKEYQKINSSIETAVVRNAKHLPHIETSEKFMEQFHIFFE